MTRVERNKSKYGEKERMTKKVNKKGNTFINIIKWIMKTTIKLVVWFIKTINKIINWVNKTSSKLFMKLNRHVKVVVIYTLIALATFGGYNLYEIYNGTDKTIVQEVIKVNFTEPNVKQIKNENKELKEELEKTKAQLQKEQVVTNLNEIEKDIYDKAIEKGLTYEQAILIISISKHETGKWTSRAFIERNNFGGVMCRTGLRNYNSYSEGLDHFVSLLKVRYFDKGLNTIEEIGAVYCPVGASNDPHGVNQYWIPNVTRNYNNYLGK